MQPRSQDSGSPLAQSLNLYYFSLSRISDEKTVATSTSTSTPINSTSFDDTSGIIPPVLFIYIPYLIFFIVFIAVYGLHIYSRIKNFRNLATSLVIALLAASIPFVISVINTGFSTNTRANIDQIPKNIKIFQVSNSSLQINWITEKDSFGAVRIKDDLSENNIIILNDGKPVINHSGLIKGLKPNNYYYLELMSNNIWYGDNGLAIKIIIK
jgi:hypothetical protein